MSQPLFHDLWQFDNPAATEAAFLALLPQIEQTNNRDTLAQLYTQIARTHSLRHQFDQAHAWLDKADALLTPETAAAHIRSLLERGRTYNSANDKAKAIPLFQQALTLAQQTHADYFAVDAAHMLAIAAPTHQQAVHWNEEAMRLAEASTDPAARQWLGALYNNLGWDYHDAGQFDKALALFEKGLRWRETEAQPRKEIPIRIARWSIGRTLRSLGRLDEALALQQALLAEWQAAGAEDGYVYEELGELLLALGRPDEARPHFAQAYQLLRQDPWLVEHEAARLARLASLGGVDG